MDRTRTNQHTSVGNADNTLSARTTEAVVSSGANSYRFTTINDATWTSQSNIHEPTATGTDTQIAVGDYFDGELAYLRVWNSARTQTQINTNKNSKIQSIGTDGLVAFLKGDNSDKGIIRYLKTDNTQANSASAGTYSYNYAEWNGTTNASWGTATNWNGSRLPVPGDSIVIKTTGTNLDLSTAPAPETYRTLNIVTGNLIINSDHFTKFTGDISNWANKPK